MKKYLIVINDYDAPIEKIVEMSFTNKLFLLLLYPIKPLHFNILNKNKNISINKSDDFINDDDHNFIAQDLNRVNKIWWSELFNEPEPHINKLRLTKIYEYYFHQNLGKFFYNLLSLKRLIEKCEAKTIFFIEKINEEIDNEFSRVFNKFKLSDLFLNYNNFEVSVINFKEKSEKKIFKSNNLLSYDFKNIIQKINYRFFKKINLKNSIIISNTNRCLKQFIDIVEKNNNVIILRDSFFKTNENYSYSKSTKSRKSLFFCDFDISPIYYNLIDYLCNDFAKKNDFYNQLIEYIKNNNPKLYITIILFTPNEIVKMWAFKNSGVRVICAPEGLGQPNIDHKDVMDNIICPEINIERWLVSEVSYSNYYKNLNLKTKISGYLQNDFKYSEPNLNNNRVTVFLGGAGKKYLFRPITQETIFGMIKFIKDINEVFKNFNDIELVIKFHPGDNDKLIMFKEMFDLRSNIKFSLNSNTLKLIDRSDIIIAYDTSVILESLAMNKDVVIYDYIERVSYTNAISSHINHYLHFVKTKKAMLKKIQNLLKKKSYGKENDLGLVLENLKDGYDMKKLVHNLVDEI